MQGNNNRFKKTNIKKGEKEKREEKRGRKRKKRREKKENSTELQKPNIEAEVYNNNKNMTERKKSSKG